MLDKVSEAIKKKFGTRAKFYRCSGLDKREVESLLAIYKKYPTPEREKELEKILQAVKDSDPENDIKTHVTGKLRQAIFDTIQDDYGGVIQFTEKHPEFNKYSVYAIIDGKRPRRTKKVNQLINKLKIKM